MHDFLRSISTEVWLLIGIFINQGLSMLRTRLANKTMSDNVKSIQNEVTHNGGAGNTLSDKTDRLIIDVAEIKKGVKIMQSKL